MDYKELTDLFEKHFPDYQVVVSPPCISIYRETEYVMKAMETALGRLNNDGKTYINHEQKKVYYRR